MASAEECGENMKILVTGGAGFIGSHVVDAYLEEGHEVIVLDNLKTGNKKNLNPKARLYECNIQDEKRVKEIFEKEKPEIVNHHAAQMNVRVSIGNPKYDAETNIIGLINILNASKETKVKKFIFISSGGAIYGEAPVPTKEEILPKPLSPYGLSKVVGEQYVLLYHKLYALPYVILRYANVYGPRQNPEGEAGVIAIFIDKLLKNEEPIIFGDGEQTRDYVYVKDVVNANILALTKAANEIINIGTEKQTTVNQLFSSIQKQLNCTKSAVHCAEIIGEVQNGALDCTKAKKILNWEYQTNLEQGIQKTVYARKEKQEREEEK